MGFAEIRHANRRASPEEQQAALAAWLAERDQGNGNVEIERDFSPPGGAGIALLEEMKARSAPPSAIIARG